MNDLDYKALRNLIEEEFGLSLKTHTRESLIRKLQPRLNNLKLESVSDYLYYLQNDPASRLEMRYLPGYIMNTESYFLREFPQFELFLHLCRQIGKKKASKTSGSIKILSAGCSEGQEPYSISMLVRNSPELFRKLDISITGADINVSAVEQAKRGCYSTYALRSPESARIMNYFETAGSDKRSWHGRAYRLRPEIVNSVDYHNVNILKPIVLRGLRDFDFIFCRNLLMYMSERATEKILFSLWEAMTDNACLFVGQSETPKGICDLFEPEKFTGVTVYRKKLFYGGYK